MRKDLIAGDTLQIVKLTDLKAYFPKRTCFTENCWPPSKGKSLLPKQNLQHLQMGYYTGPSVGSQNSISSTRWTRNVPNEKFNHSDSNSNNLSTRTFVSVSSHTPLSTMSLGGNSTAGISLTTPGGNPGAQRYSITTSTGQRQANLAPQATLNSSPMNTVSSQFFNGARNSIAANNSTISHQIITANGQQIQIPRNQVVTKSVSLSKIRAIAPPVDYSRLSLIPEHPECHRDGAYTVRMVSYSLLNISKKCSLALSSLELSR